MFKSIKTQIVFVIIAVILTSLFASTYFIINQKEEELNLDIFKNAVNFAELTHERIINNYENNYTQQAFVYFDREMADIYSLNKDISSINIYNYKNEILYQSTKNDALKEFDNDKKDRIQSIYPSVKTKGGRTVYLDKSDGDIRYTNENGIDVAPLLSSDQIVNIIYPFKDANNALRSFSVEYLVNYDSLAEKIKTTRLNMFILAGFAVFTALLVGSIMALKITSPIKDLTEGVGKIGSGDLDVRVNIKSKTEIGQLANTFNKMASDLKKNTEDLIQKEKMTRELELAGQIQRELLPKTLPNINNLDIAASLKSADEIGGDCYDFLELDKNNLIFYIGDVTGHGVPAGLVSAINNALVPAFLEHYKNTQEIIIHLNKILKLKTQANVFMTMVMANWNSEESLLSFTQAGHDPILLYKANTNNIESLEIGGMALGMIDDVSNIINTHKAKLYAGDVAVFYTDGIPEAWKNDTENYGMKKFKESILKNSKLNTAKEIHDAILKDVYEFMGDFPQADDITLIVIKRV